VLQLFRGLLLHAGTVDPTGWLWSDWTIEPTIALGVLALVAGYLILARRGRWSTTTATVGEVTGRQRAAFIAGAAVLFIALGPPLDDWSDHYLLSAHMVQHLLLILLVPPLLLYGVPAWILEPLTRNRITNIAGYWLTRAVIAFAIANAVLVLWHIPDLYDLALYVPPIHVLEHMTMLATAMLSWWAILGPLPQWPRLALPLHSLYYFAMTLPGAAVGAFITFADPGLYVAYDTAPRVFGIDLATDQQIAGLLMWVVVSAIYLLLTTVAFFRWVGREDAAETAAPNPDHVPAGLPVRPEPSTHVAS
jgi:putative membrane protein